ncbi:MAG: M20/M25/M40 family metallo-hydrolase [Candidatus Cryptobacteroides sp.]|nr:M20/M25/M40 family metallo-hydrolase [Candidatus Cryptobacteroides sp.]MEE3430040.1 M20/M25/M40 family metallo-hydrolase [Candidatus Cryptobacteroides sp.]
MDTVGLLMGLIRIPSFSREEGAAADFLEAWMRKNGFAEIHRAGNNLWVESGPQDERPTILLNAHIDTVKPSPGYTRDPFEPALEGDVLYGLGSNDDGGSLVALMETYSLLLSKPQPYRLVISATAEEEVCGKGGFDVFLQRAGKIDFGIIGEPTAMNMAVAEKGLMVLDCTAHGVSGHAARNEGKNAIYEALPSIEWFRTHVFPKVSEYLGSVKMTVTQITAGTQHNVIPDRCDFVVDVRSNGLYSNPDLLKLIKASVRCDVKERSTRIGSSNIPMTHPVVKRGLELGLKPFGSPTTSNQALASFPTLKIGPGDSCRSHTANEYIHISEIRDAVETYYRLLDGLEI